MKGILLRIVPEREADSGGQDDRHRLPIQIRRPFIVPPWDGVPLPSVEARNRYSETSP
jgi:hypothetical protein